jgi:hypothetical protein
VAGHRACAELLCVTHRSGMLVSWLVSFQSKLSIEQVFFRKLIKEETGLSCMLSKKKEMAK